MVDAVEADWATEYLGPILSVKIVEDVDEAMAHIARYGSDHTESIVTENASTADRFLREVDSGSVMHNASTPSPMASSTDWVQRSASQPASSTPEVPSVLRVSPRKIHCARGWPHSPVSDALMHDESGPVGFLGGSFDPVHIGHLRGAMAVREALNLLRVDLVPAAQSPLKPEAMLTGSHRLAMLELAIADVPGLGVDARELDRAGPSFTIDTLEALRAQYGGTRALVWIIGADSLVSLPRWARWHNLLSLAHVAVLDRPGSATPPEEVSNWLSQHRIESPALSSRPAGGVIMLQQPLLGMPSSQIRESLPPGTTLAFCCQMR